VNERLRILLLVSDLGVGGAERQLVELARALDRRRFEPIVATLYGGRLDVELAGGDGTRLVCLERRNKYDFTTVLKLARFLRRERVHVIHPFLPVGTFFGFTAALLARTPIKIAAERGGVAAGPDPGVRDPYGAAHYFLMRFADIVVPNSESGADDVVAHGVPRDRIRVIYNGVNPDRIAVTNDEIAATRRKLGLPANAPVVGIVARLDPMKDHETFLRAAARVRDALPEAYFVVVGDGPLRAPLEALSRDLGLGDRAIFAGSDVRVAPYIGCFDVAVLSSYEKEGCSNFILEAMGLGKPVVCTTAGGNPELVEEGQTGHLVPIKDADCLAQRMLSVLSDPRRARAMGRRGREAFERRFALERMVHEYESLYDELWARRTERVAGRHRATARESE